MKKLKKSFKYYLSRKPTSLMKVSFPFLLLEVIMNNYQDLDTQSERDNRREAEEKFEKMADEFPGLIIIKFMVFNILMIFLNYIVLVVFSMLITHTAFSELSNIISFDPKTLLKGSLVFIVFIGVILSASGTLYLSILNSFGASEPVQYWSNIIMVTIIYDIILLNYII